MMPHGRILLVVDTPAPQEWPAGWDGACVWGADWRYASRAGTGTLIDNASAWHDLARGQDVGVWIECGRNTGGSAGALVREFAPWAAYIVLGVHAISGGAWDLRETLAIVDGCREAMPGTPIGFATYPTGAEASARGVNWAALREECYFAVPMTVAPHLDSPLEQVWGDHGVAYLGVAPEDDSGWLAKASESVHRSGAVFVWHGGMADARTWGEQIPAPARQAAPVASPDPLTPGPQAPERVTTPFVAWDGSGWWVTDLIRARSVERGEVETLVRCGLQVIFWPECGKVTVRG